MNEFGRNLHVSLGEVKGQTACTEQALDRCPEYQLWTIFMLLSEIQNLEPKSSLSK